MKEEWREVRQNKQYEVSNLGRIRYCGKEEVKRLWVAKPKGYLMVTCYKDGNKKYLVHRLVADAFIGNVDGKIVDHVDRNKLNNKVDNLRFCTVSQSNQNRRVPQGQRKWRGVDFLRGSYYATIKANGISVRKRCGSEAEAILKYNKMAKEMHGEFAVLNVV